MRAIRELQTRELTWVQRSRKPRTFEMLAGDESVILMRWERRGSDATAESAGGRWSFQRQGYMRPGITIRDADSGLEVATFRGSWDGGGLITLRDGRTYAWNNTNWQHTAWAWTDRNEQVLLRFKGKSMTIEPSGLSVPELPLLAALSWYLNIVNNDAASVASTGAVVVAVIGGS